MIGMILCKHIGEYIMSVFNIFQLLSYNQKEDMRLVVFNNVNFSKIDEVFEYLYNQVTYAGNYTMIYSRKLSNLERGCISQTGL